MRRKRLQLLLFLPLIVAIGFPWVALQSAAWAGMLVKYARTNTLTKAAAKTFDGKAPCQFCLAAARGLTGDDEQDRTIAGAKFEWLNCHAIVGFQAPIVEDLSRQDESDSFRDSLTPPLPPPRFA